MTSLCLIGVSTKYTKQNTFIKNTNFHWDIIIYPLSPQSFLSMVNLLSSSQSVWELLDQQPLANKSQYSLREMPTSIPVSVFQIVHFRLRAVPLSAIWWHVCTFYLDFTCHLCICLTLWRPPPKPPHHWGWCTFPILRIVNTHTVFILHHNCCTLHSLSFYAAGFDWQADCCEFRCKDSFPVPLWAVSHIWPEVRLIFLFFHITKHQWGNTQYRINTWWLHALIHKHRLT